MRARLVKKQVSLACVGVLALSLLLVTLLRPSSSSPRAATAVSGSSGAVTGAGDPAPRQRSRSAARRYLLIDAARLASLPTSGSAYAHLQQTADDAMRSMRFSSPNASSPWLPNYDGAAAETLAAALIYARTGEARYRDFVIAANRFVIGSEDSWSNNGTSGDDKLLATMRQISGYVLAADLVDMDPNAVGSRAGYTSTQWSTWLEGLRTKSIGSGNCSSIVDCNLKATNWGAWASASRTAIDLYLGDVADLEIAVGRLKLYLGETTSGVPWKKSGSYDQSWECLPSGLSVEFVPVNGRSCGAGKDGIIVEDASRSASSFPSWDDDGIDYSFQAYAAQLLAAILLDRSGYDVWNWGDRALKRIMDRLHRLGVATGNDRGTASHVSWIPRYFYGTEYPTTPAAAGNTLGYTDWLFATAPLTLGRLSRNTRKGTALLVVRVPGPGKLVLSGRGLRRVARTLPRAGELRLRVVPTDRTRKRLASAELVRVRAKVRFYPTLDAPQAKAKSFNLLKRR